MSRRLTFSLLSALVIFFTFLPLESQAIVSQFLFCDQSGWNWWDKLVCYIRGIFNIGAMLPVYMFLMPIVGPLIVFAFIGVFLSFVFYAFCSLLLSWVMSPHFVSLSLTQLNNPIINSGWHVTSGLVNLAFVLVLVFIALATILRLESYGLKKLLPKFLVVLLIVNFSLVICGVVVDIANVVTRNFLTPNLGTTFLNTFLNSVPFVGDFFYSLSGEGQPCTPGAKVSCGQFELICPQEGKVSCACPIGNAFFCALDSFGQSFLSLSGFVGMLVKSFGAIFFGLFAGFVLLLYVILFMIRVIAIWLLAILAPIAWFCWILPFTQKFFRTWWSYFLQWSFVGAIAGFFLYLSGVMIGQINNNLFSPALTIPESGVLGDILGVILSPISTVLNGLFAFGAVIAFLIIGFFISIKMAGGGTEAVLKWGEKGLKAAGGMARTAAERRFGGPAAEKAAGGLGVAAKWGEGMGEKLKFRWRGKEFAPLAGLKWATRGVETTAGEALRKYAAKVRKIDADKEMGPHKGDIPAEEGAIDRTLRDEEKVQKYQYMAEEGTLQKTPDERQDMAAALVEKFAGNPHYRKEAGKIADVIANRISAEAKIKLEPTLELQGDMKKEIIEEAAKLSQEVDMKPVIDEEAKRLVEKGLFKTEAEAQGSAARNVAARKIHITELKQGDIKDMAKSAVESMEAARAFRDMTSQHLQAVVNNFKPKTSSKVLDQTFNAMFRDETGRYYSDEKNVKILEDYLSAGGDPKIAQRRTRMFTWSQTTPAGRETNLIWRKYMRDSNDQPTTNWDAFERRRKIQEELSKQPVLQGLEEHANRATQYLREIEHRRREGRGTAQIEGIEARLDSELWRVAGIWRQVERTRDLLEKEEEIEGLRRPPGRRGRR